MREGERWEPNVNTMLLFSTLRLQQKISWKSKRVSQARRPDHTDVSEGLPAVDVGLVHHAGWPVLLGYGLGGGRRLSD